MKYIFKKIEIIKADITKLEVDAIVNAANSSLLGGGGVDGAIHNASGPKLLEECKKIHGCPTGEARITKGYNLHAKYVIHTVGPVYSGIEMDKTNLNNCYKNSFELAKKKSVLSIAFPAISCGVYGYPIEKACKIAIDSTITFLKSDSSMKKIIFALFSDDFYNKYSSYLSLKKSFGENL